MNMARRLRRKFILATMLAVSIVLAGIIAAINVANWLNVVDQAERRLDLIAAHNGSLPQPGQDTAAPAEAAAAGNAPDGPGKLSPETPFETRFFTVTLDADGTVVDTDTSHIAAVDADQAASWAKALAEAGTQEGFQGSYRYRAIQVDASAADEGSAQAAGANTAGGAAAGGSQTGSGAAGAVDKEATETGTTLYVFLDCSRDLDTFRTFLVASTGVSAIGWLLVLALTMGLARVAVRPIAESYEKQKRFITDASHEIKTPLSIIDASCEVVELTAGPSEWTASIHTQVERLSALTERLVLLARMDEGAALNLASIDLSETVAAAAEPYRAVALAAGRTLAVNIEPHLAAHADAAAIGQATELLLDNAMRYASPGSTIDLTLTAAGRHRRISVRNRCDEVPTGDLDRLFERFYRADEARSSATGGSGIGLAAVRAIAEAHRGRAHIETPDAHTFICIIEL